jgi:hypothetical protein
MRMWNGLRRIRTEPIPSLPAKCGFQSNGRMADHPDTIARGGGWSFRTWCYSGKSRLMFPHQSDLSPTALVVLKPASATSGPFDVGRMTGRPLDEDTQCGIRQFSARNSNQKQRFRNRIPSATRTSEFIVVLNAF